MQARVRRIVVVVLKVDDRKLLSGFLFIEWHLVRYRGGSW